MPRCADWRAPPLPPRPDAAATPRVATGSARRRLAPVAAVVIVVATVGAFVYAGLHPVRLLANARYVGPADPTERTGYVRPIVDEYRNPPPGTEISTAGDGFPYEADLADGRRHVELVFPEAPTDPDNTARPARADTHKGELFLSSDDADGHPCIGALPDDMGALAGATADNRLLTANVMPGETVARAPHGAASVTQSQAIKLARFGILDNPSPIERFEAETPRVGTIGELAVAPDGNHLLWAIGFDRTPNAALRWLAAHFHPLARFGETHPAVALYVTGVRGEEAVRIGEETAEDEQSADGAASALPPVSPSATSSPAAHKVAGNPPPGLTPLPDHFHWDRDGKMIRFVYGANEYAVAVNAR